MKYVGVRRATESQHDIELFLFQPARNVFVEGTRLGPRRAVIDIDLNQRNLAGKRLVNPFANHADRMSPSLQRSAQVDAVAFSPAGVERISSLYNRDSQRTECSLTLASRPATRYVECCRLANTSTSRFLSRTRVEKSLTSTPVEFAVSCHAAVENDIVPLFRLGDFLVIGDQPAIRAMAAGLRINATDTDDRK